jgi:hypothetical protein
MRLEGEICCGDVCGACPGPGSRGDEFGAGGGGGGGGRGERGAV